MDKTNLVLLPGLLNAASLFQHQVENLSDIAAISIGDLSVADSIPAMAAHVLENAPAGKFVLVGMSMGGYVALEIMRQAPKRVQALVLISTSARPDTAEATAGREVLIKEAASDFQTVIEKLLVKMAHPDHANTPEVGSVFQSMASGLGAQVFERQQRAIMGRADSLPSLAAIKCPTLILCGADDQLTPPALHHELLEGIRGARLEIIEHSGHLLPLEQPEQVSAILREWLGAADRIRADEMPRVAPHG